MTREAAAAVEALLVAVAYCMQALLLGALEHTGDRVDAHVEALERRAERQSHEVVAW